MKKILSTMVSVSAIVASSAIVISCNQNNSNENIENQTVDDKNLKAFVAFKNDFVEKLNIGLIPVDQFINAYAEFQKKYNEIIADTKNIEIYKPHYDELTKIYNEKIGFIFLNQFNETIAKDSNLTIDKITMQGYKHLKLVALSYNSVNDEQKTKLLSLLSMQNKELYKLLDQLIAKSNVDITDHLILEDIKPKGFFDKLTTPYYYVEVYLLDIVKIAPDNKKFSEKYNEYNKKVENALKSLSDKAKDFVLNLSKDNIDKASKAYDNNEIEQGNYYLGLVKKQSDEYSDFAKNIVINKIQEYKEIAGNKSFENLKLSIKTNIDSFIQNADLDKITYFNQFINNELNLMTKEQKESIDKLIEPIEKKQIQLSQSWINKNQKLLNVYILDDNFNKTIELLKTYTTFDTEINKKLVGVKYSKETLDIFAKVYEKGFAYLNTKLTYFLNKLTFISDDPQNTVDAEMQIRTNIEKIQVFTETVLGKEHVLNLNDKLKTAYDNLFKNIAIKKNISVINLNNLDKNAKFDDVSNEIQNLEILVKFIATLKIVESENVVKYNDIKLSEYLNNYFSLYWSSYEQQIQTIKTSNSLESFDKYIELLKKQSALFNNIKSINLLNKNLSKNNILIKVSDDKIDSIVQNHIDIINNNALKAIDLLKKATNYNELAKAIRYSEYVINYSIDDNISNTLIGSISTNYLSFIFGELGTIDSNKQQLFDKTKKELNDKLKALSTEKKAILDAMKFNSNKLAKDWLKLLVEGDDVNNEPIIKNLVSIKSYVGDLSTISEINKWLKPIELKPDYEIIKTQLKLLIELNKNDYIFNFDTQKALNDIDELIKITLNELKSNNNVDYQVISDDLNNLYGQLFTLATKKYNVFDKIKSITQDLDLINNLILTVSDKYIYLNKYRIYADDNLQKFNHYIAVDKIIQSIQSTLMRRFYATSSIKIEKDINNFEMNFNKTVQTKQTKLLPSKDIYDENDSSAIAKFWNNISINPIQKNIKFIIYDDFNEMVNDDAKGTKTALIEIRFYYDISNSSKAINSIYKSIYIKLTIDGYSKIS